MSLISDLRYRTTSLLLLCNYLLYFGGSGRGRPAEQGFALMYLLGSRLALKMGSSLGVKSHQNMDFSKLSLEKATFSFIFLNSCQRQKPLSAPALEVVFELALMGV